MAGERDQRSIRNSKCRQPIKKPCNWCVSRSIAQLWITETSSCRHRRELPVRAVVCTAKHEGWQVPRRKERGLESLRNLQQRFDAGSKAVHGRVVLLQLAVGQKTDLQFRHPGAQWKRPRTREVQMRRYGLDALRAWRFGVNGRGLWWNPGARHMVAALPPKYFTGVGLVSLVTIQQRLQRST